MNGRRLLNVLPPGQMNNYAKNIHTICVDVFVIYPISESREAIPIPR